MTGLTSELQLLYNGILFGLVVSKASRYFFFFSKGERKKMERGSGGKGKKK